MTAFFFTACGGSAMPCHAKDTLTVHLGARVIDVESHGMTTQQWEQINTVNAPAWQAKQCCMAQLYNRTHERQVTHDYCNDPLISGWIAAGICPQLTGETR